MALSFFRCRVARCDWRLTASERSLGTAGEEDSSGRRRLLTEALTQAGRASRAVRADLAVTGDRHQPHRCYL